MKNHKIEYRIKRKIPIQLWAWFQGTKKQARESAKGLLDSLRDDCGYNKARVFVDGKMIKGI